MVENMIRQTSKKTWYQWSIYINLVLFFIVALFLYLLVTDCISYGRYGGDTWLYVTRDIGFIAIALSLIFFQFMRNIYTIIRRTL